MTAEPTYEIYAFRYHTRSDRVRSDSYLLDKNPNAPDTLDYYFWIVRNADRTILVDTGLDADTAKRLGRPPFEYDPATMLREFGIDPAGIETLIVTHMHFDHVGALPSFPKAKLHLQEADLAYASGSQMTYAYLRYPYERTHVSQMVDNVHAGRVIFHDGDGVIAPGITVHRIDGHARGLQVVRINTKRGHVVLSSDAAAYAEHFLEYRISPIVVDAEAMLRGYDRLRTLADSEDHIITGHDPLVGGLYPRVGGIALPVFRVDEAPSKTIREAHKARWAGL